jgi:hypothetical protein
MANEIIPNNTLSLLPEKYYEVFALRITGLTYKQIAEKTGYAESTLKQLFSSEGVLKKFYRDWVAKHKADDLEESLDMMFAHLPDIVRARILQAKGNDMGAFLSSKLIFENTLGKPEERMRIEGRIGIYSFADWIKEETLKDKNEQATKISEESAGVHEGSVAGDNPVEQIGGDLPSVSE